jgi:hypothetical protein
LSGDKKVGFLSRDVEKVEIEIGRVLPNQLQHLAPQMSDFSRPALYGGLEDKLVERFATTRDYSGKLPGKPTYDSIDVAQYLQDKAQNRRGLFLLHIRAKGTLRGSGDEGREGEPDEDDEPDDEESDRGIADTRLVLVTDLGFIVKEAKDGSRNVFVQSIRSGLPVEGARIDLIGSNGQPMLTATTDAGGRAQLPKPSPSEARREKTPQLILAQKDGDVSFLPFDRTDVSSTSRGSTPAAWRTRHPRSNCRRTCSPIAASTGPARPRISVSSRGPPTGRRRSPGYR